MEVKITSPFEIKIPRSHEAEIKTTGDSTQCKAPQTMVESNSHIQ